MSIQGAHLSERWFLRFVQICYEIGLSGGLSEIACFCHVIKNLIGEYSWQIFTLNFCKKGVACLF